jgi:hypothetical protein
MSDRGVIMALARVGKRGRTRGAASVLHGETPGHAALISSKPGIKLA